MKPTFQTSVKSMTQFISNYVLVRYIDNWDKIRFTDNILEKITNLNYLTTVNVASISADSLLTFTVEEEEPVS